jgi:hypothetical protein
MSSGAVSDITLHGYEPPRNVQFAVFLDNRVGKLRELLDIFNGQSLKLAGFSILDSADHAVIRLLTSRSELARRLLEQHQIPYSESDVLVVELTGTQTMKCLCDALLQAELSIHFAYPLLVRPRGKTAIAVHTDDRYLACQILRKRLFTILAENDLGENALRQDEGPDTCAG